MTENSPRQSRLSIDLGGADVALVRVEVTEGLSQQFHISIDILSLGDEGAGEIDILPHLGKPALVTLLDSEGTVERYFHGIVVDGEFLRHDDDFGFYYRLTLRPHTYLLEQRRNFRIFQQRAVPTILQEMLVGFETKFALQGSHPDRKYCLQYDESDFGFMSRLMEEAGIYYYYDHTADGHEMVLVDSSNAHRDGKVTPLVYNPANRIGTNDDYGFVATTWHERVSTGAEAKVTMRDYDFKRSKTLIQAEATDELQHPDDRMEVYAYPGRFYDNGGGKTHATAILESRRATRKLYSGDSLALGIAVGVKFALKSHAIERYNAPYLVTQTRHAILAEQYRSGDDMQVDDGVWFEAIPADVQFRAPLTSRRPVVAGPETAVVIGEAGKEIWCDEFGRVKVQFHWDRDGHNNDSAGCWIRVAQTGHLGNIIIPRVGQEVLVDFINGDPDRPIIVGRVFNDEHMPLYTLPENETRAVWRSQSIGKTNQKPPNSPTEENGWSPAGGNEITLEDKAGAEEVMIRAELDMKTYVTNNDTIYVGKDRTEKVIGDEKIDIEGGQTVTITKDQKITVKGGIDITATDHITLTCGGSTITMKPGSIEIKTIQLTMEGSATADLKSAMTTVQGSATVKVTGGMVLINS